MPVSTNDPQKKSLAAKWGAIAAMLAAIILVIDFFTKSIGLVQKIQLLIRGTPDPVVLVKERPFKNSSSCLEFAFADLPESFALGEIRLAIIGSEGPDQITGNMASDVFEKTVNDTLSPAYLVGEKTEIVVPAQTQASKPNDAFYLDYCPTLTVPGTKGAITVIPTFLGPTGDPISPLRVNTSTDESITKGISLKLVRPKNEKVTKVETIRDLLPQ